MIRRSRLLGEGRKPSDSIRRLSSVPIPDGEVEAGKIAEMELELDKECILERARTVSIAPNRMPYIGLHGRYNKRWYVDIVSLPHNSIRTLISKLFEILVGTHIMCLDMTENDFEKLFAFISEFDCYLRVLLDAEEKILYQEVEGWLKKMADYQSHPLHPKNRALTKEKMYCLLDELTDEKLRTTPSVIAADKLQQAADLLSTQLLEYFSLKEKMLPKFLAKSIRGIKEKTRLEGRLIKYFEELSQEFRYTAILMCCLGNDDVRNEFKERHFSKAKRDVLTQAADYLEVTLLEVPRAFNRAAKMYEERFSMKTFVENYGTDRDVEAVTEIFEE